MAKYKVGDRVRIVGKQTVGMNDCGGMDKYLGSTMTIGRPIGRFYKMVEDNGEWLWDDNMIAGLVNDKVELHPDFAEWYKNIEMRFCEEKNIKSCAIYLINQIGFGKGLEDAFERNVTQKYPELKTEMQDNKEKYTRAILDDNWTVRKEQLYYVELSIRYDKYLNQRLDNNELCFSTRERRRGFKTKFTEKEIKAIDERYLAFKTPVEED